MRSRGFTLIELLVVVAIIGVLLGILVPLLGTARRQARTVACMSNMRQITAATLLYAEDHHGQWPRSSHSALASGVQPWAYALSRQWGAGDYEPGKPNGAWQRIRDTLLRCPEDTRTGNYYSYGKSVWFELGASETGEVFGKLRGPTFTRVQNVPRPAETVLYGELNSGSQADHIMAHYWYLGGSPEVAQTRHGNAANYALADGHVETRIFKTTYEPVKQVDFWYPGTVPK